MRLFALPILLSLCLSPAVHSGEADSPRKLVAQLYRAHNSKQDPLQKTDLLASYFGPTLLKLYLRDKREAAGEIGRLDFDPLYNAQDTDIEDFSISSAKMEDGEKALVTVTFKNMGKPARIVYILERTRGAWKISDIRYPEGLSLRQILERDR